MDITQGYVARWTGEGYPEEEFVVYIARLDKPEYRAYWDTLTEEEQDIYDETVFYYVHDEDELKRLYEPDWQDFQLIGEA